MTAFEDCFQKAETSSCSNDEVHRKGKILRFEMIARKMPRRRIQHDTSERKRAVSIARHTWGNTEEVGDDLDPEAPSVLD